jgi:hypothetical protein
MARIHPLSRLFTIIVALLLLTGTAFAGEFMTTTDSGAKVWADYVLKGETATWTGSVDADGYATGSGTMRFLLNGRPAQVYQGQMSRGRYHGSGKFAFLGSGDVYEGQFVDGRYQGQGLLTRRDSSYYDGNWYAGQRNGQGTYRSAGGVVYDGQWLDDRYHGSGVMTWPSGVIFAGEWQEGRQVKGTITWPEGGRYEGDLDRLTPHGQGTMTWKNGDSYTGAYARGSMTGKGTWRFFNGYYYEGDFERGEFHGSGRLYAADGRTLQQGNWSKGKFIGDAPVEEAAR